MKYRAPVEGVKIEVSEATYQRLKAVALANISAIPYSAKTQVDKAIGYWCECKLREFRNLDWTVPMPKTRPTAVPASAKQRHFQIGEWEFAEIERYAKARGRTANQWIAATVLYTLDIEMERLRGAKLEADRFG